MPLASISVSSRAPRRRTRNRRPWEPPSITCRGPGTRAPVGRGRWGSRPTARRPPVSPVLSRRHDTNLSPSSSYGCIVLAFRGVLLRKSPFLLLLLPTALFADEVFIKGAGSISGRIVSRTPTQVMVDVGGGTVGVSLARVDHIVMARTDLDEYDERAGRLSSWDINGWRALGRWASLRGMEKQARQAYERIVAIMPDDPEAEGALGFVMLDGNWVTQQEAYRARGFVRYEGEWMMPAEAQLRLDGAAAEQARLDAAASARAADLEKLKAEVKAQYDAEAARDEEWRAEGAAWFYSHAYGCGGCGYGPTFWPGPSSFHGRSWHGRF